MTDMEKIVYKSKKMYSMLSIKLRNELLRSITTDAIAERLGKDQILRLGNPGRLYAISDTKRQKIFKSILESDETLTVMRENSRFLVHMDTVVFKIIFDIMKEHLKTNTEVLKIYPEYFI